MGFIFYQRLFIFVVCYQFCKSEKLRCFECQNLPFPRDCGRVSTCSQNEYCSVEQVITPNGAVVYNTGCKSKEVCQHVLTHGDRVLQLTHQQRSTDVTTCLECCTTSFCNNAGCGGVAVAHDQRGPYCFTCSEINQPEHCEFVSICPQDEMCMLFIPQVYINHPDPIYRGQCESENTCKRSTSIDQPGDCPAYCCRDDFCNSQCDPTTAENITTPQPHLESTTHMFSKL